MTAQGRRLLAVPVLGEHGGGVGQVSQLLWRTMQDEWGPGAEVLTLLSNGHAQASLTEKWRFGVTLAGRQWLNRPDWIFFSHIGLARIEHYLPDRWGCPYGVFLHGIECWSPLPDADRDLLKRAALRVANSSYTARRAAEANPGLGEIVICPLALPERLAPPPPAAANPDARPTVLVVGRLSSTERYKGHEQLIRAWPSVERLVPGARLVIVGDGDDAARLRSIAASSGGSVEFTGFLPRADLDRRYAEATLFALPSRGEGFGLVYLEAMAAGLACIGSIHDAASEVVVDGLTGLLVDPDDSAGLSSAIASLLSDPGRARVMGEAGRARARASFSYEQFRQRMTSLLHGAFGARKETR